MIRNYFKIALRNLLRNKTFSFIKIAGLSIGLCVCMLILLYTRDEVSFDRFHEKHAQIYRIVQEIKFEEPRKLGITAWPLGPAFEKEIPEISGYVRTTGTQKIVKHNKDVFTENFLLVDNTFFSVFSFPLLRGNPATALSDIHSVVLSEDMAKKYFGNTDALGKTMQLKSDEGFENFTVTGVAKNNPQNSTISFDMLLPYNYYLPKVQADDDWIGGSLNTFLLLDPKADTRVVEQKMQKIFDDHTREQMANIKKEEGMSIQVSLSLEPITNIHLGTYGQDNGLKSGSSLTYSYILSAIAVFILIVACINFINLSVAQSLKRSKEIGIRKVVGSTRKQLIRQFLAESLILSSLAFALAILLVAAILPFFNEMTNKQLSFAYLADFKLYAAYFLLLVSTAFIAGFYPSLVLSSFQPVKVLYGRQKIMGRNYFTRGLVVLQFALAVFLIICTIGIYTQLDFLYHKDLGYNTENLVRIDLPSGEKYEKFRNELLGNPSVLNIAGRNRGGSITGARVDGKDIETDYSNIDENFLPVLKIALKEGRNFSSDFPGDKSQSAIVNESFVKKAGWRDPLGKTVSFISRKKTFTVVGVIKDYNFRSLKRAVDPQFFALGNEDEIGQLWIKIEPGNVQATMASVQNTLKKISPFYPFSYQFMEDQRVKDYEADSRWKQIIGVASVLFIFISCIGLLGLVILSVEQRTKEIGIRKVMGAAVSGIAVLISREFILLIGIAFFVAIPAGYYAVNQWLQNFAYRIDIYWWIFASAGFLMIIIASATISFQAIKAAMANPVKNLRTE